MLARKCGESKEVPLGLGLAQCGRDGGVPMDGTNDGMKSWAGCCRASGCRAAGSSCTVVHKENRADMIPWEQPLDKDQLAGGEGRAGWQAGGGGEAGTAAEHGGQSNTKHKKCTSTGSKREHCICRSTSGLARGDQTVPGKGSRGRPAWGSSSCAGVHWWADRDARKNGQGKLCLYNCHAACCPGGVREVFCVHKAKG